MSSEISTRRSVRQDKKRQSSGLEPEEPENGPGSGDEEETESPPRKRGRPTNIKKDHDFEQGPDEDGLRKKGPEYVGTTSTKIKSVAGLNDSENGIDDTEAPDETEDGTDRGVGIEGDMVEDEEEEEGVVGFTSESLSFDNVERLLLHADDIPRSKICTSVPSGRRSFLGNISYVIDLDALPGDNDIRVDSLGKWGTPSGRNRYYIYKEDGTPSRMFFKDGKPPPPNIKYDVKIMRNFYRNPSSGNKLYKKVFKSSNEQGETLRYAVVAYEWAQGGPMHFEIGPHGNARGRGRGRPPLGYQPRRPSDISSHRASFGGHPKISIRGATAGRGQRLFGRPRSPRPSGSPATFGMSDLDGFEASSDFSGDFSGYGGTPQRLVATTHDPLIAQKRELIRQQSTNAKLLNTVLIKTNKLLDKMSRAPIGDALNGLLQILGGGSMAPLGHQGQEMEGEAVGQMPEEGANVVVHEDGEVVQYQYGPA